MTYLSLTPMILIDLKGMAIYPAACCVISNVIPHRSGWIFPRPEIPATAQRNDGMMGIDCGESSQNDIYPDRYGIFIQIDMGYLSRKICFMEHGWIAMIYPNKKKAKPWFSKSDLQMVGFPQRCWQTKMTPGIQHAVTMENGYLRYFKMIYE